MRLRLLLWLLMFGVGLALTSASVNADPATRQSERIARFGDWYVVKKPATYVIAGTGKRGRYTLCSAVFFGKNAWLEFEAKNDKAWSFYVAYEGWKYSFAQKKLTLKSASQKIQIASALYGGAMISGMSHNIRGGRTISMNTFLSFISQRAPISFYDNRGSRLITFPNKGDGLSKAFRRAIQCSLAHMPM